MDNFTHSLAGWALGQAGLKTKSRKGLAALILGANAPDIDVFFQWAPWEPLATHRGFTHSLVGGVVVLPLMLWGLLLLLDHWQVRRGAVFKSGLALDRKWLLALCCIGALTHPLLDLQTTYAVQLFSPFSGLWWHTDNLFIIDAVLWTVLPLSIAVSRWREKRGRPWRGAALTGLAVALVYIAFNLGLTGAARAAVLRRDPAATELFASPPPVLFWKRDMVWRHEGRIARAGWDPLGGNLGPTQPLLDDGMDDPIAQSALAQSAELRNFLYWSILPTADVERKGCQATVYIGDARYGGLGRNSRLYREAVVRLC